MSVNVNYKNPYGHYTTTSANDPTKKIKIQLCRANCLWAEMFFYKNEQGVKMAQLYAFIGDVQHLKNCFINGRTHLEDCNNYVFYSDQIKDNKEIWKAIQILAEHGKKITIK